MADWEMVVSVFLNQDSMMHYGFTGAPDVGKDSEPKIWNHIDPASDSSYNTF